MKTTTSTPKPASPKAIPSAYRQAEGLTEVFDYWFVPVETDYRMDAGDLNQEFATLGSRGWQFCGVDSLKRNVFRRAR